MAVVQRIAIGVVLLGLSGVGSAFAQIPGFTLPPGFVVTEFAGDDLAHDIYTMTIDARGRVFVAGRGYIRQLIDERGEGKATRILDVADNPKDGAQGLLVEGDTLYAVGDGALRRFQLGPDGRAIGKSVELARMKTGQEHTAHAIRRGPDGWLYLLCGDATGDFGKMLPRLAPIKLPVGGFMLRLSPDFGATELIADGFRNPYDFDFTNNGEPITFDSDNERCVGLPWYEGCRVYHIMPGGHYGWRAPQHATTWRMPPYFIDVVAPILDLGRGSPTGVACYRHRQFPEHYRGGMFLADWTFGRIWFVKLTPQGGSYKGEAEPFLQSSGDLGLAPTALAVHPLTGDLYVSIGGRGTRGAVYRISYPAGERAGVVTPAIARDLATFRERRSLELLARKPLTESLIQMSDSDSAKLVGRLMEHIGSRDRAIRQAAMRWPLPLELYMPRFVTDPMARTTLRYWQLERGLPPVSDFAKDTPFGLYGEPELDLILIRGIQHYFGDIGSPTARGTVFEGYSPRNQKLLETRLRARAVNVRGLFPSGNLTLDRESARLYALIGNIPGAAESVCQYLSHDLSPIDELHFLIVLARLEGARSAFATRQTAAVLLDLDRRYTEAHIQRDSNWPLRMMELHAELSRKDPNLNRRIVDAPDFARPGNAWLTRAPGFDRRKAALTFLDRAERNSNFVWNVDVIALLDAAPADLRQPWLDRLWEHGGFEESLLPILASGPRETDRSRFNDGLRSPQREIAAKCLAALEQLPPPQSGEDLLPIVRALRSLGDSKADAKLRDRLAAFLRCASHQSMGSDRQAWTGWFADAFPNEAAKLGRADGVDRAAWNKRLSAVDWGKGDASRGRGVFEKASCAACHSGVSAIGPDLHGVANRFSRDDLLTAILEPSKDIAPQYRSVQLLMKDGKVHQGIIVYDSPDGIMLQTGATTAIRMAGNDVESCATMDVSLMPAGLLDKLADGDIADLLAYLKSLK